MISIDIFMGKESQASGALIGFVNSEEIIARKIKEQSPHLSLEGYLLLPNKAFADSCDTAKIVDDDYIQGPLIEELSSKPYDFVHVGPILALLKTDGVLRSGQIPHVGSSIEQLRFELDKTAIFEIFPPETGVLPPTEIVTTFDPNRIKEIFAKFTNDYVVKFVGDYTQKYRGSEAGRVRFSGETLQDTAEALDFVRDSIEVSGRVVIQAKIKGQQFSANFIIDRNGNSFRLGENICFKRRNNGDAGPMCDATGSISVNNSLPFLSTDEISYIQNGIVEPFVTEVARRTGQPFISMLNLDLIKGKDGKIYLLEINCREAGGHTLANLLSGLETDLGNVFSRAQEGTLNRTRPQYSQTSSVVVSAFPSYFPEDVRDGEEGQILKVSKRIPQDVKVYTGWVDVLEEDEETRTLRLYNSPSLIFEHSNVDLASARKRLYQVVRRIVQKSLDFRTDIGK